MISYRRGANETHVSAASSRRTTAELRSRQARHATLRVPLSARCMKERDADMRVQSDKSKAEKVLWGGIKKREGRVQSRYTNRTETASNRRAISD